MPPTVPPRLADLVAHSRTVIRSSQAPTGAYLASPSFPVYRYSWFRDGAFIADGMSRVGEIDSAEAFFAWCAAILVSKRSHLEDLFARDARGERIAAEEFLPTRFTVDGEPSGEAWWDFQLDGYGAWLWALDAHARRHARDVTPYLEGATLSAQYIARFWREPGYDWWEEHPSEVHVSTLGAVAAGLSAAATWPQLDEADRAAFGAAARTVTETIRDAASSAGFLPKWIGSDTVDASLISVATPFGVLPPADPLVSATVRRIESTLVHAGGGVHRYATDSYYGGGLWLNLAAFLGWHYARTGRTADAQRQLEWIAAQAVGAGDLPEQVPLHLLDPDRRPEWLERWGPVATPLLWSHGQFLALAAELGVAGDAARRP